MPRHFMAILFVVLVAASCRSAATPTPTEPPTPEGSGIGLLRVLSTEVGFREREPDEAQLLAAGDERPAAPGSNVLVGTAGHAEVVWSGLLVADLISGADTLISLADMNRGEVILDQAAGTARYDVSPQEDGVRVEIKANWATVTVTEAPAAFIVSYVPTLPMSVWIAVLEGSAAITREADAGVDSAAPLMITAGQAVGLTDSDPWPAPAAVDMAGVRTWYIALAAGTAEGPIGVAALRCEARTAASLLAEPGEGADATGAALAIGDVVDVRRRSESAAWALVRTVEGGAEGWVPATGLTCNGPIEAAPPPVAEPPQEATATETAAATPTRGTVVPRPTATPTLPGPTATATVTATPTEGGTVEISFSANPSTIDLGGCSKLTWDVKNIDRVYLDGTGVAGSGEREVCPTTTTTYNLEVHKRDGNKETRSVTVTVRRPEASATPEPTTAPTEQPTNTTEPPTATTEPPTEPTGTPES